MRRRPIFVVAMTLLVTLGVAACVQGKAAEEPTAAAQPETVLVSATAAPTAPVTKIAPAPEPTGSTSPAAVALAEPELAPSAELNGAGPAADPVSLMPADEYLPTVDVVKLLSPSVVQIVTESLTMGFFNEPSPRSGVGTGEILDEQGHILTNNHVIDGAQSITVTLSTGDSYPAVVVGGDPLTDIAVIRIEAQGLRPVKLGRSSELQVGEDVIAIGHALGLDGGPTVSKGVVSALGRSLSTDQQSTIVDLIQTDASINPGNSGGPLVNAKGEVIGINTAIIQGSQGIGFAINIDDAKVVAAQLMERGYVQRGFLGLTPFNLTPGLAERFEIAVDEGVIVVRVMPGLAAAEAGLMEEDVIVQLGDEQIRNTGELSKFLITHLPGETVDLVYLRGAEEVRTQITLGERPA